MKYDKLGSQIKTLCAVSILPTKATFYNKTLQSKSSRYRHINPPEKIKDNRSFNRLYNALQFLIMTSPLQFVKDKHTNKIHPFKLNFITLTLSEKQKHTDQEIQRHLLQPFLKWILRQGAKGYVWKAEKQHNGNIHYHITTNQYINWKDIRNKWNDIQYANHYLDKYYMQHKHYNPNSTDIKAVRNNQKAIKYMAKYIMKIEDDKANVEGHVFGYSKNLTNLKITIDESDECFKEVAEYINNTHHNERQYTYNRTLFYFPLDLNSVPQSLLDKINKLAAR